MIVHSFDEVLRQPKMLHAIELGPQARIPLWRPVPWIGVAYLITALLMLYIATKVPVLNWFYEAFAAFFSPAVYYSVLSVGLAMMLFQAEFDGIPPHWWLLAYALYLRRPNRTLAGQAIPMPGTKIRYGGKVMFWWDLNAPRLHDGWVRGGKVSTTVRAGFTHSFFRTSRVIEANERYELIKDYEVDKKLRVRG